MSKIPTAEEFLHQSKSLHDMWDNTRGRGEWDEKAIINSHIEFARLHVEACKKEIAEKARIKHEYQEEIYNFNYCDNFDEGLCFMRMDEDGMPFGADIVEVNKDSILNAYPLTNIK